MYSVYVKNFERNNTTITSWEKMFEVPDSSGDFPVSNPVVKASEDSAENYSFSMEMDSPYYSSLLPLKTIIRVVYDGDIIFMGRVFMISTSSVFHTKNVTCQGVLSYFNDTYYEGKTEKKRTDITTSSYFTKIINNHNNQVSSDKQINKGNLIGITLPTDKEKFEPSSWSQTMSLLNGLTNSNGGHFIIRYSGTTPYLDWYKYYNRDLGQNAGDFSQSESGTGRPSVTIGKNILDISSEQNVTDVFTRLIPIGGTNSSTGKPVYISNYTYTDKNGTSRKHSGKALKVTDLPDYLYTDNQLTDEFHKANDYKTAESRYGIIYKTQEFPNATTKSKLWSIAKKWVKECYFGINQGFTVKAFDMHIQDSNLPKILLGDCVDVTYKIVQNGAETWETRMLICKAVSYDLFNPENNTYTFGLPTDLLQYNKYSKTKTKTPTVTDPPKPTYNSPQDDNSLTWFDVYKMIADTLEGNLDYIGEVASERFWANGEIKGKTGKFVCTTDEGSDGDPIGDTWVRILANKDKWFDANVIGKIDIPGKSTKWVAVSSERGVFAYINMQYPCNPVTYWYTTKGGYKYTAPTDSKEVTFDDIAEMIENDTTAYYGGSTLANQFRTNGRLSTTAVCYVASNDDTPGAIAEKKFNAKVVGKFKASSKPTAYVAQANNQGVFAFHNVGGDRDTPKPVAHWYKYDSSSYTPQNNMVNDDDGNVYGTDDGLPDGKKTIVFGSTELPDVKWPEWVAGKKYAKGAIVKHNDKVYRATPPGSDKYVQDDTWIASHWTRVEKYEKQNTKGTVNVGYDTTGPEGTWSVTLNKPIIYTDQDGNTQVAEGGVTANDFNLNEVPSFKTRLAVVDVLIAGCVTTGELQATNAYIDDLVAGRAVVTKMDARMIIGLNKIRSKSYILSKDDSAGGDAYLENCFSDCLVYNGTGDNEGKICFDFYKIGGGLVKTVGFKIADTQTYKDGVSAARTTGWNAARAVINNSLPRSGDEQETPNSDWSLHIPKAGYNNGYDTKKISVTNAVSYEDGKAILVKIGSYLAYIKTCDNLVPENIKKDVKILGVTGSYTASHKVEWSPCKAGFAADPGSGYTEIWTASTWKFKENYWYTIGLKCGTDNKFIKFKLKM